MTIYSKWIAKAVQIILEGTADKLTKENVTVYKEGDSLIRIDIKVPEEEQV